MERPWPNVVQWPNVVLAAWRVEARTQAEAQQREAWFRRRAAEVAEERWQAELDQYDGLSAVLADVRFGLADGRDDWLVPYAAFARRRRGQLFLPRPLSEAAAWHGWCGRWPTLPRFPV